MPDLFISVSGADRAAMKPLLTALQAAGVTTFYDTENINPHEGISDSIRAALDASTALLAFFSHSYANRQACQQELISAFISAHPSGQVRDRILVVNPEANEDHIEPVDLRDPRFHVGGNRRYDRQWAAAVAEHLRRLPDTFGSLRRKSPAPKRGWFNQPVRTVDDLVDRHPVYWRLQSALNAAEYPLIGRAGTVPVAVLHGMTGIGKTTAMLRFAKLFEGAYPGGILHLPGRDAAGYRSAMAEAARWLEIPVEGVPQDRLRQVIADHLGRRDERCLWLIDDVPAGRTPADVESMIVPAGNVHTVLSTKDGGYDRLGVAVPLDGLDFEQSLSLILRASGLGSTRPEIESLVGALGGHPLMLVLAGAAIRDGRGLRPLDQHRRDVAEQASRVLASALDGLDPTATVILRTARSLAPTPIPTTLVEKLCDAAQRSVIAALKELESRRLIARTATTVAVHPMITEAVGTSEGDDRSTVRALAEFVRAHPGDPQLVAHVRHVLAGPLPPVLAIPLLSWLLPVEEQARDRLAAGHTAETLCRRLIEERGPADADALDAALRAVGHLLDVGEYARTQVLAEYLLDHLDGDRRPAVHALARAFDGLGRFDEAWPHWTALRTGPTVDDTVRIHYARALRLRGRQDEALAELNGVHDVDSPWRLAELAMLHVGHGRPRPGRQAAERAADGFARLGLTEHPVNLEVLGVMVDADLLREVWVPLPFTGRENKLLERMRLLVERYTREYGPDNPMTLTATVRYGIELAGWMKGARGRDVLTNAERRARDRLGPDHPARLGALYGLSLATMMTQDYRDSLCYAVQAHEAQVRVLGERHRDTLRTLVQLSAAWYYCGDPQRTRELLQGVPSQALKQLGVRDPETLRTLVLSGMSYIPTPVGRTLHQITRSIVDRLP